VLILCITKPEVELPTERGRYGWFRIRYAYACLDGEEMSAETMATPEQPPRCPLRAPTDFIQAPTVVRGSAADTVRRL
jgi:hypothetical protein